MKKPEKGWVDLLLFISSFNKYLLNTMIYQALRTWRQQKSRVPAFLFIFIPVGGDTAFLRSEQLRQCETVPIPLSVLWNQMPGGQWPERGSAPAGGEWWGCLGGGHTELWPLRMSSCSVGGVRDLCRALCIPVCFAGRRRPLEPQEQGTGSFRGRKVKMLNFFPVVSPE